MIYKVSLNGKIYEVEVEKGEAVLQAEYDAMLPQAAPAPQAAAPAPQTAAAPAPQSAVAATAGATVVCSQFSGDVTSVVATAGQTVKEGDIVMVIEAMKMSNDIPAPKSGKIGQIFVQKGAKIDMGAQLFEIL